LTIRNLLKESKTKFLPLLSLKSIHIVLTAIYTLTTCILRPGFIIKITYVLFLDFSMRELDGLKVWDEFGFIGFTFKIADSESSVLREALKPVLLFLTVLMTRTANKVHIRVYLQYPTFNWVSSTHIHRGIIYRKSHTLIPWYLILCNNIVYFFTKISAAVVTFVVHIFSKLVVTLFKEMSNIFRSKDSFW
jgi:hypothetical protein